MGFINGFVYNIKGLWLGIRTPKLLLLGMIRFFITIAIAIIATGAILIYHNDIMTLLWLKPQSPWIIWLWYLVAWFLMLLLIALSTLLSYLFSQIMFSVWIMDKMARITETIVCGQVQASPDMPFFKQLFFLATQEIPRAIAPVVITLLVMVLGWFTPLGPVMTVVGPAVSIVFLAWDNTDLIPARKLLPFGERLSMLTKALPFHLGFGLLFLIPVANILILSFAPVGATLYHLEKHR